MDRKKIDLAGAIATFIIGLLFFIFLLNPLIRNQSSLSKKKESLQREIKDLRLEITRDRQSLSRIKTVNILNKDALFLTKKEIQPFILKYVSRLSKKHHITILNIKPAEITEKDLLLMATFHMDFKGDFFNIYNFIHDMESTQKGIKIHDISIDSIDNNKVETRMTLKVYVGNKGKLQS